MKALKYFVCGALLLGLSACAQDPASSGIDSGGFGGIASMAGSMLTALFGSWFGVRRGISELRNQLAFTNRFEWYQQASESALSVRYSLQRLISSLKSDSEASIAEKKNIWDELNLHINELLNTIPQATVYARATTYRKLGRIPHHAQEILDISTGKKEEFIGEEDRKKLHEFRRHISIITRLLTDDLRNHLGLKSLSPPQNVKAWYRERKSRKVEEGPLASLEVVQRIKGRKKPAIAPDDNKAE